MDAKDDKRLVSVIVPTKDSSGYLGRCLESVRAQTYPFIEIIVSDNASTDDTCAIAKHFGATVIHSGNERSRQVNEALAAARGEFVYRVDSDFILDPNVIAEAVSLCDGGCDAIAVHNDSSDENGFWARVRKFERAMYRNDDLIVAARFMRRSAIERIGGFDESLVAGEDYDLHNRLMRHGYKIGRTTSREVHLGEPRSLSEVWKKNYYYGKTILRYVTRYPEKSLRQASPFRAAYFKHWRAFLRFPTLSVGFVVLLAVKYSACLAGAISAVGSRTGVES